LNITPLLVSVAIFIAPIKATMFNEMLWTPLVCALLLLAAGVEGFAWIKRGDVSGFSKPSAMLGGFVGWVFVSLLWHWVIVHHGSPIYLDPMIRAFALTAASIAVPTLIRPTFERAGALTASIFAMVFSAGLVSIYAVVDYIIHATVQHMPEWREFGLSSPDFFAGLLVVSIPLSFACYLSETRKKNLLAPIFWGSMTIIQILAMITTGSRFANISLPVGIVVMAAAAWLAKRGGLLWTKHNSIKLGVLLPVLLVGIWMVKAPLSHRFQAGAAAKQANSGSFRVLTWRGALRMAEANPVIGTGLGTFQYSYQKYAITGFTMLAHNSFLQTLDETGAPGLILVVLGIGSIMLIGTRSLAKPEQMQECDNESSGSRLWDVAETLLFPKQFKIIQCGLLGSAVSGIIQNLIDSNWSIPFNIVTFWFIMAAILTIAEKSERQSGQAFSKSAALVKIPVAAASGVALVLAVVLGVFAKAESSATVGQTKMDQAKQFDSLQDVYDLYHSAIALNPIHADYYKILARGIDPRVSPADVEGDFQRAIYLEPGGSNSNCAHYAHWLLVSRRGSDALKIAQQGLELEPNNVNLWDLKAKAYIQMGDIASAKNAYAKAADLQASPVGTVLALNDIVDLHYIDADIFLGQDALASRSLAAADHYFSLAKNALTIYATDERASNNVMRMSTHGNRSDPVGDQQLRSQFDLAASSLISIATSEKDAPRIRALTEEKNSVLAAFDKDISDENKTPSGE